MTARAPCGAAFHGANALDDVLPPATVVSHRLTNGLRVLARRKPGCGVVAIATYVGAGYFDETDDIVGIAHVLEHMYFKGTPTRGVGEIARETKAAGGVLNAATIYDHTHYYAVLPAAAFEAGLAIQADAYANSLIDQGELSRELEVIIEEAKRKADSPTAVATESLFELMHDVHRVRRWRIGREPGLRALRREHVYAFYRRLYRPGNSVIAIVGDVDPDAVVRAVESRYGHLTDGDVMRDRGAAEPARAGEFRYRELDGDVQQSELVIGWRTPGVAHADSPALDMAAALLAAGRSSRLYQAVRDRQLASSMQAWNYTPGEIGMFVLHARAKPETAPRAMGAAWAQLAHLRDGDASEAELARTRVTLYADAVRRLETAEGQAHHLGWWELNGGWRNGGEYLARELAADRTAVANAASRWLPANDAAMLTYRPRTAPPFAADAAAAAAKALAANPGDPIPPARATTPASTAHVGSAGWTLDRRDGPVSIYRTAAGVPILIERSASPIAYLGWFVEGGAAAERPENSGITMLMARAAVRGTTTRDSQRMAEDAENIGAALGSATIADGFQWTISAPIGSLERAAELLADVVLRPAFRADAVDSERAVMLADLKAMRDDMHRWPMRLAMELAWYGDVYGRSVSGTEASLATLDAAALRDWHEAHGAAARGAIVCVADGDPDDIAAILARRFSQLALADGSVASAPAWASGAHETTDPRDKAQSALAMLFPGPGRRDPARYAAALLAGVASGLGGRFFDVLRDQQSLCYTVMVAPVVRRRAGAMAAYIATSPEKEDAARRGLLAECARLAAEPVTAEELQRAKTYAIGTHAIRRESAGAIMSDLADAWLHGDSLAEIAEFPARIQAVTAEAIRAVAAASFDPAARVEGIVRGAGRAV